MSRRRKPRIGKVTSEADARPADDLPTKAIPLRDLAARPAAPRWRARWEAPVSRRRPGTVTTAAAAVRFPAQPPGGTTEPPVSIAAAGRPEKTRDCGADFAALLPDVARRLLGILGALRPSNGATARVARYRCTRKPALGMTPRLAPAPCQRRDGAGGWRDVPCFSEHPPSGDAPEPRPPAV